MARLARRVVIALVSVSVVCGMLSQVAAEAQPPSAGCVALGLKSIHTKLSLVLAGDSAVHIPTLEVSWSAKPLPKRCGLRTVVAVRARVRFVKTGRTLEFGPEESGRWRVFWLGRTHVHDAETSFHGPAETFNLGCVERPQAWLRYDIKGRGGRSLERLVRAVPITSEICER